MDYWLETMKVNRLLGSKQLSEHQPFHQPQASTPNSDKHALSELEEL